MKFFSIFFKKRSKTVSKLNQTHKKMNLMTRLKTENGASAVEFAIVLPLFITLVFGIIEFGILLFDQSMITNAGREGARLGSLYKNPYHTDSEITAAVMTHLDNGNRLINLGGAANMPGVSVSRVDQITETFVTVTVNYTYDFLLVPNFVPGLPGQKTLRSATTMRVEK